MMSYASVKMSSTRSLKNFAMRSASVTDGTYLPFSIDMMVCLDTRTASARTSCVTARELRISLRVFGVIAYNNAPKRKKLQITP